MYRIFNFKRLALLAVLAVVGVVEGMAIDYWTQGKVVSVLKGGEETSNAGLVYVSSTELAADQIAGVPGSMTAEPYMLSGAAGTSAINKEWYFYASDKPGYKFLGFASTASGNPSGTGLAENLPKVGDYYFYKTKAGAGWSENTAETAKVFTRYAVYEKVASADDEPTGTDGVNLKAGGIEGADYESGTESNHNVYLTFEEALLYNGVGGASTVNQDVQKYITVKGANNDIFYTAVKVSVYAKPICDKEGAITGYEPGKGSLQFSGTVAPDEYAVHLPYSLFKTVSGKPSAAVDFTLKVMEKSGDLVVVSTSPANGVTLTVVEDADTEKNQVTSPDITVTLTFSELLTSVDDNKAKEVRLTTTLSGEQVAYRPANVYLTDKMQSKVTERGSLAFPQLPNGTYTLTLPEGVFYANSKPNKEFTLTFTLKGSDAQPQAYKLTWGSFTPGSMTLAMPAKVSNPMSPVHTITASFVDKGFGVASEVVGNAADVKEYNLEVAETPVTIEGEEVLVVSEKSSKEGTATVSQIAVNNGVMTITFAEPIATTGWHKVVIPAGIVANQPKASSVAQNITNGYAENTAYELYYYVKTGTADAYTATLKVTDAQWGTFVAPFATEMPKGVVAYTVKTVNEGSVSLEAIADGHVAANTPVVVYSKAAVSKDFSGEITSYEEVGSPLVGVFQQTYVANGTYILQNHDGKVAFYYVDTTVAQPWIAASRCYLSIPTGSAKVLEFDVDDATGIKAISDNADSQESAVYDLQGRQVAQPVKGLYIVNGKKVVIK